MLGLEISLKVLFFTAVNTVLMLFGAKVTSVCRVKHKFSNIGLPSGHTRRFFGYAVLPVVLIIRFVFAPSTFEKPEHPLSFLEEHGPIMKTLG